MRQALGLTQAELAERLGYAAGASISKIECGATPIWGSLALCMEALMMGYDLHEPRYELAQVLLYNMRTDFGLTQQDFAYILGLNRRVTISDWETGRSPMPVQLVGLLGAYEDGYVPISMQTAARVIIANKRRMSAKNRYARYRRLLALRGKARKHGTADKPITGRGGRKDRSKLRQRADHDKDKKKSPSKRAKE